MRQTFTVGQTVYITRTYSAPRKAVVAEPDKQEYSGGRGNRPVHYVGVHYVKPDGTVQDDRTWYVLNNRRLLRDEAAFTELQQGKRIAERRGLMSECDRFEREFALFIEQADIIIRANANEADQSAEELALYLRGMFSFRSNYSRMTRDDVRKLRRDNAEAARVAVEELRAMGVEL